MAERFERGTRGEGQCGRPVKTSAAGERARSGGQGGGEGCGSPEVRLQGSCGLGSGGGLRERVLAPELRGMCRCEV